MSQEKQATRTPNFGLTAVLAFAEAMLDRVDELAGELDADFTCYVVPLPIAPKTVQSGQGGQHQHHRPDSPPGSSLSTQKIEQNGPFGPCPPAVAVPRAEPWPAPPAKAGANAQQVGGSHYKTMAIEHWDYVVANNIPYLEAQVIKYVSRWRSKNGLQDLEKARHFLDKLIEHTEKNTPVQVVGEIKAPEKSSGQVAYEAYFDHAKGKSLATGTELPPWSKQTPEMHAAWEAVARKLGR